MEFGRSFSYPFARPNWVLRTLVGAALEVVPMLFAFPLVVGSIRFGHFRPSQLPALAVATLLALACRFVVLGYLRRVVLDALSDEDKGLPAWDRFGEDLVEGMKLWLVGLGLMLPALGITASFAFLFQAMGSAELALVPVIVLLPPLLLATFVYLPAALVATVAEADMTAAFDVSRVGGVIARAVGPYLLAFLIAIAAEILAQLGLLLLCVGIFATRFLAHCLVAHAFGTVYRAGAPAAAAPATEV